MPSLLPLLVFILLVFLVVKWVINTGDAHPSTRQLNESNELRSNNRPRRTQHQPVNQTLVQQVQQVAPGLHVEQIKYALQLNRNNVQLVIENYLNGRDFPYPPGYTPPRAANNTSLTNNETSSDPRKVSNIKQDNLLSKFNVTEGMFEGKEIDDPTDMLQRKQFMVYKAREDMKRRLETDSKWADLLQH